MWLKRTFSRDSGLEAARQALDDGRLDEARAGFELIVQREPGNVVAWWNLGLANKFRRDWAESQRCNRRAAELDPRMMEAYWNMGVAATAQRDWEAARWAWNGLGFDVGVEGPPAADYGPAPVRLDPAGDGEVVWGKRIDPCRVRLFSVPLPESGHRWGDVLLHDVVPAGERMLNGRAVSVFDELIRMDPSEFETFESTVTASTEPDVDALLSAANEEGLGIEDWTTIRIICRTCSYGPAHDHEGDTVIERPWQAERRVGMAGPVDRIREVIDRWSQAGVGRSATAPAVVA